jgi:hypothetical protein
MEQEARLQRHAREHDARRVDAQALGRFRAAQHDRRGLVHVHLGAVPLVVRKRERPVRFAGLANEGGVTGLGEGGVGEARGHPIEARPQASDLVAVLVQAAAFGVAKRAVDQRERRHGRRHPALDFEARDDLSGGNLQVVGLRVGLDRVDGRDLGAAGDGRASRRLAAHHDCHVQSAVANRDECIVEERLLGDSHLHQHGAGAVRADAVGDEAPRVRVRPRAGGHGDLLHGAEQPGGTRVFARRSSRGEHQLQGLEPAAGLVDFLARHPDARHHRRARLDITPFFGSHETRTLADLATTRGSC